jgi:opacity protein-like surface antigen
MKKVLLVLVLACVMAGGAFADWWDEYAEGVAGSTILINAGIGYGSYSGLGWSGGLGGLVIDAAIDYALPIEGLPLSVGAYFNMTSADYGDASTYYGHWVRTLLGFGVRPAWHFNFIPNFDIYAGIGLGWVVYTADNTYYNTRKYSYDYSFFDYGGFVGLRWYFLSFMGVYVEAGYTGLTYAKAGLAFKF